MEPLLFLVCLALDACTPVRSNPGVSVVLEGTQTLSQTELQATTYRVTLRQPPSEPKACDIELNYTLFRSGEFDAGAVGNPVDITLATRITVQVASLDADGGIAWWDFAGSRAMPGSGDVGGRLLWAGTSLEHVEYVRVLLEAGTAPPDAKEYLHRLGLNALFGRDDVDLAALEFKAEVFVDGGWAPANTGAH